MWEENELEVISKSLRTLQILLVCDDLESILSFLSQKHIIKKKLTGNILIKWQNCTIYFLARLLLGITVPWVR